MRFKSVIFWLLALSLLSGSAMAEDPAYEYKVISFEKGLNNHASSLSLQDNQASDVRNVRFNSVYGSVSKRPCMISLGTGSAAITGLHRFYKADATQKTIKAEATYLYDVNDDTGVSTQLVPSLSDGKWWTFVTYKNIAIGTNGYDQPVKWDGSLLATANTDGHRTAGDLAAQLGAPFAELNTGSNLDASKWYQYKVAFYDGTTYSYSTAKSNPIATGSTVRDIRLTDIPLGPVGTTHRYIYRTLDNANRAAAVANSTYYLVGTIANNTATTLDDAVTDSTASMDSAPTWTTVSAGTNVTPPLCKYAHIHNERLFMGGNPTYPSYIYWSDEYNPQFFSITDYDRIREDDGDAITFLKTQLGVLIIGKENTIQKYYTDAASDASWYPSNPFSYVGCCAPYSVANTPEGIVYLSKSGLYLFNGQSSTLISDAVTPEIKDILETQYDQASGVYWKNEYQLAYTSLESAGSYNNRVLVYDIIRDAYSLDYKTVNVWAPFNAGQDTGVLYSGSSDSSGTIYAMEGSANILIKKLKSDFTAGTFDDARVYGEEISPVMELAWDCTINGWLTELQSKDASITTINSIETYLPNATIDRPDGDGSWTSPGYQVNADKYEELRWNETLTGVGNVTFKIRSASTEAGLTGSWSDAYTNPNGSDISGETANVWVQVKIDLTSSDTQYTPTLQVADGYLFKLSYTKSGQSYESAYDSYWQSGWEDFGFPLYKKNLRRIKVYYTGTNGKITVNYKNEEGDIDNSFDIDMGVLPPSTESATDNKYTGTEDMKCYTYWCPDNSGGLAPIGQWWMFKISDNGDYDNIWTIHRIEVMFEKSVLD